MSALYIIGNGFDIHHGLNTSYKDFSNYLIKMNSTLYGKIENFLYYEVENKNSSVWNKFEYNLRNLDEDAIYEECDCFLKSYGDDDWRDSYHYDYQQCIDEIIDGLTNELLEEFTKWIKKKNDTISDIAPILHLNKDAMFITFNYTMTLENVYGICPNRILHIHNSVADDNNLILGHNYSDEERVLELNKPPVIRCKSDLDELLAERGLEEDDIRYREGKGIVQAYYNENYKNSNEIIKNQNETLESLKGIDRVYVLGHSVSEVDMVYFDEVLKYVNPEATWIFSWFNEIDKMNIKEFVHEEKIKNFSLCRLCDI